MESQALPCTVSDSPKENVCLPHFQEKLVCAVDRHMPGIHLVGEGESKYFQL